MGIAKISGEKLDYLKRAIERANEVYNLATLAEAYEKSALTPMRFRWDCLWKAGISQWINDHLYRDGPGGNYTGVEDTHIDTALRGVMRDLGLFWAAKAS